MQVMAILSGKVHFVSFCGKDQQYLPEGKDDKSFKTQAEYWWKDNYVNQKNPAT